MEDDEEKLFWKGAFVYSCFMAFGLVRIGAIFEEVFS